MSNTITSSTILANSEFATIYVTLQSDGSNETATTLYDSSAVATTANVTDSLDSSIMEVYCSSNAAATARIRLLWDATTDVVALDIPTQGGPVHMDFWEAFGGLPNQGGSGKTGDINLTTTGLASGDSITLVLKVKFN